MNRASLDRESLDRVSQNSTMQIKILIKLYYLIFQVITRGGSRAAAISKIECFVIIVNGFQPLTIITKHSILDVTATLDPPLIT